MIRVEMSLRQVSSKLKVLFLTNAHNSMSQRAWLDLSKQHQVSVELATSKQAMITAKTKYQPDVIICPMLTSKVPEEIYSDHSVPCWIVHPGVQGDRGMSSIDWALKKRVDQWGVTILQADQQMDAGDIWSSKTFAMNREDQRTMTKSSLYKHEVIQTAMLCLQEAIHKFVHNIAPTPLDYSSPFTIGQLNETMSQSDRKITWHDTVDNIVHNFRFSDSQPGIKVKLHGDDYFAYNGYAERCQVPDRHQCGDIVGHRDDAIAVAAKDGLVWISTLKNSTSNVKLPAMQALTDHVKDQLDVLKAPSIELENFHNPLSLPENSYKEIWTCTQNDISYVHFNFSNGACSTKQCRRLENVLSRISQDQSVKGVVLMGGYDTFSNGIHLNVVESADDPLQESVDNINAIDDVIKAIAGMTDKVTISALQGGAGAGGVMMAAAADHVLTHEATVLNPHYRLMGLYGSEYWTYFLPQRVGYQQACQLTEGKMPISAQQANKINLVDAIVGKNVEEFRYQLVNKVESLIHEKNIFNSVIINKRKRNADWFANLDEHRKKELKIMEKNFGRTEYNYARRNFVKKTKPVTSPAHLPGFQPRIMIANQVKRTVLKDVKAQVEELQKNGNQFPKLCFLTDSNNCLSANLHGQMEACKKTGVKYSVIHLNPQDCHDKQALEEALRYYLQEINQTEEIDGIVTNPSSLLPVNINKIALHLTGHVLLPQSSSGQAITRLLLEYGMQLFRSKVTIISDNQTKHTALVNHLKAEGTKVLVATSSHSDLKAILQETDITIATDGIPSSIDTTWFKQGSAVLNLTTTMDSVIVNERNSKASLFLNSSADMESLAFSTLLHSVTQVKLSQIKTKYQQENCLKSLQNSA